VDHLGGVPVALERSAVLAEIELSEARILYQKVEKKRPIWTKFMVSQALPVEAHFARQLSPTAQILLDHPVEALTIWPVSGRFESSL
jgi:hypothetical protein